MAYRRWTRTASRSPFRGLSPDSALCLFDGARHCVRRAQRHQQEQLPEAFSRTLRFGCVAHLVDPSSYQLNWIEDRSALTRITLYN
jgi:hypothetical protein